ncbi:MAG: response regulator [Proteobacteria bacterium]|nr:response regulator [Pseudomonadota bacterium]
MPKARILAVDDQRYFRELIEGLLTEEGYQVQTAASGDEALHILEREDFDIVITDLVMPGVDGTELVQRIKERLPDQEIIMVTGVVDVKTAVEAMKQGATDYILKPFDRKSLSDSLDKILQRRRLREEHERLMAENLEYMEVLSLYERALGLFSTLSVEALAERLVESLCLETGAQGGVVWLAEDLGEPRLSLSGVRGLVRVEEEPETIEVGKLESPLRGLVSSGATSDVLSFGKGANQMSALCVVLRHSGQVMGVARLTDKLEGGDWSDRDRAAAEKFVEFGATAAANALRYRSLERRSFKDPTTKAYSYAYFRDVVRNEIQKAGRFGRHFSLIRLDVGAIGTLRRRMPDAQLARSLEDLVHHLGGALRATDLLAAESEQRYAVLLPETDALGAAILKERMREALESSDIFDALQPEERPRSAFGTVTYPTDGTQLDSLDRVLDERLVEDRDSLLRGLDLERRSFSEAMDMLLQQAGPVRSELFSQTVSFLLGEAGRRADERALLFIHPTAEVKDVLREGLERLRNHGRGRAEVVLVADTAKKRPAPPGITFASSEKLGCEWPFLLFFGEGPAYALVGEPKPRSGERMLFHTSDRPLVEHLAFQLQRELGLSLGA